MIPIDQLIRSRRKTIALIVTHDGRLVVRAPLRTSRKQIDRLVQEKAAWIRARQAEMQARPRPAGKTFRSGESFLYLGHEYPLRLSPDSSDRLVFREGVFVAAPGAVDAQAFIRWYRLQARTVLSERIRLHAVRLGYQPGALRITSARTRWGSCSSRGTLSFPWRLVLAPVEIIDYVVIHELVHLEVKNHSRAFWERVAAACPAYQAARQWLKDHSGLGDELLPT